MGTSCISVLKSMGQVPGLLLENVRRQSCEAGCEPRLDIWDKYAKEAVLRPLVEDGAKHCEAPESQEAVFNFLDQIFQKIKLQCSEKLSSESHFCDHPERLKPFVDCAKANAIPNSISSLPMVLPYMSERTCKNTNDYATSSQLWEHDFPKHLAKYIHQCHEL